MPASRHWRRSSSKALAVTATIGGQLAPVAPRRAARMARGASSPSSTGMCTSISTRSTGGIGPRQHALGRPPPLRGRCGSAAHLAAGLLQQPLRQQRVDVVVLDQQHGDRLAAARARLAAAATAGRGLRHLRRSPPPAPPAAIAGAPGARDRHRSRQCGTRRRRPWPPCPARRCPARSRRSRRPRAREQRRRRLLARHARRPGRP